MLTEAEAKTKWCPLARAPFQLYQSVAGVNRDNADDKKTYCIGSACMAWRFAECGKPVTTYGYCGAFGRPK